ncbi:MAG: FHA domain-containing protein [Deltaproteobacteria bacterium]|nr:FHA domain-containing protein [Deltaproteobacteria bacterium]
MDQSKKTMRHFYCRDVLWETFEQMANDFDCSIDYLINEAMRYYARSKNYQAAQQSGAVAGQPGPGASGSPPPMAPGPNAGPAGGTPGMGQPAVRRPGPPPPMAPRAGTPAAHPSASMDMPAPSSPSGRRPAVPPAPPPTPSPVSGQGTPTLYLIFNNQRISIDKDQFIIGRGSKTSDLAIKDGNISRKHAAVIRRNGTYYVKDLGSTNGIDYKGMRIDNKRIDEGDIFHLCDYELRFTYR